MIEGRVVDRKPATSSATSSARKRSSGVAGDALGGLVQGSAISRGLRSPGKQQQSGPGSPARRVLVAEFALCMVIVALSPVTDRKRGESPVAFMKRASAVMAVFFVLGLIASGGRGAGRAAAGFGGLVTLTLAISSRSLFVVLAGKVGTRAGEDQDDAHAPDEFTEGAGTGFGNAAGDVIGGIGDMGSAVGGAAGAAVGGVRL